MKKHALYILAILGAAAAPAVFSQPETVKDWKANIPFSATIGGPTAPDGTPVQCDLPKELHLRNIGGSDGAGLCVFTSIEHAAYWHNIPLLYGWQKWCAKRPGGGYPSKVDRYMDLISKEKGYPKPSYRQIESRDLTPLKTALKTGRMVSTTYYFSPSGRYGGARIAHMVSLFHLDEKWACVMDNNFPKTYEWMTPAEFLRVATGGSGQYWAVVFMNPGPPPVPKG